ALSAIPLARLRLQQRAWFFALVNLANIFVNIVLVYLFLQFIPSWKNSGNKLFDWYAEQQVIIYFFGATLIASVLRYLMLVTDGWRRDRNSPRGYNFPLDFTGAGLRFFSLDQTQSPGLKKMLAYAAPLVIVATAGIVNTLVGPTLIRRIYSDDLAINEYWAGQYGAAMKLAVFLNLFIQAYNYAAEPFFFRSGGKDPRKVDRTIYADAARAFALLGSLAVAAILLLLPIAQQYLGEDLREGLGVLPILLVANLFLGLYYNFAIAYKLTDKTMLGGRIALIGSTILLLISILLMSKLGIYAPALGSLACFLIMCILAYRVSRKYFPVSYPIGRFALYFGLTAIIVYLGWQGKSLFLRFGLLLVLTASLLAIEAPWLRRILKR
ncbi:MAG: polysaccharide biosynthesis C-terminal domain-containing protein, partial [Bacteroidota bacterium]